MPAVLACWHIGGASAAGKRRSEETMPTICITNQKGGVGKTTTAVNVAAALAGYFEKRVLLIDFDTQCNATRAFGYDSGSGGEVRLGHLLEMAEDGQTNLPIEKAILPVEVPLLDLLPGQKRLAKYLPDHRPDLLAAVLGGLSSRPDFTIIDCPPGLNLLTTNAIFASDWAIVPCEHAVFSLEGLADLLAMLEQLASAKRDFDPTNFYRILLTKVNPARKRSTEYVVQELTPYKDKLFRTVIRENDSLNQAHAAGKPVFLYDSSSVGAMCYHALTRELLDYEETRIQKEQLARAGQPD